VKGFKNSEDSPFNRITCLSIAHAAVSLHCPSLTSCFGGNEFWPQENNVYLNKTQFEDRHKNDPGKRSARGTEQALWPLEIQVGAAGEGGEVRRQK